MNSLTTGTSRLMCCARSAHWTRRNCLDMRHLLVAAILLYVTAASMTVSGQAADPKVKILFLNITDIDSPLIFAVEAGFRASLWSRNYKILDRYSIDLINKQATLEKVAETISELVADHPELSLLLGPFGDVSVKAVLPALEQNDLVAFSPFTGSTSIRHWKPNLYFTRASPILELQRLLQFTVNNLQHRRLGFMYLKNVSYGDAEFFVGVVALQQIGYNFSSVFTVESNLNEGASETVFAEEWERFANGRPEVVFLFGLPVSDTEKFLLKLLTDPRTSDAKILCPSYAKAFTLHVYKQLVLEGLPLKEKHVFAVSSVPLPSSRNYEAMRRFRQVMGDYLTNSGQTVFEDHEHFLNNDDDGELMVAGWIAGEILYKALTTLEWQRGRKVFMDSLFSQRRYLVDDLVIGDYGGECNNIAEVHGAICRCNEGGRTVYVKEIVDDFRTVTLFDQTRTFPSAQCYNDNFRLFSPLTSVAMMLLDSADALRANEQMMIGMRAASSLGDIMVGFNEFSVSTKDSKIAEAASQLDSLLQENDVYAVPGVATDEMMAVKRLAFISPILSTPRLNVFKRNVIHLLPTIEQELFTLATYLRGIRSNVKIHTVVRSDEAVALIDLFRRSLFTFDGTLTSMKVVGVTASFEENLPTDGDVFLLGITADDVGAIATYLEQHKDARVFIPFYHVCMLYERLVDTFSNADTAHRLQFVTSLPHWSDPTTTSTTGRLFLSTVKNITRRTPYAMSGFATSRMVLDVISNLRAVNDYTFLEFIYNTPLISVDDMSYGPFSDGSSCTVGSSNEVKGCGINFGATLMSVWSMARAIDSNVPALSTPIVPSMQYRQESTPGLSKEQIIGVILGCTVGFVVLVGILFELMCCCDDSRNNEYAPQDLEDPVTIIFTDIESSTSLWATCPEIMPDAVATHHRIIRSLIAKYKCYEVKTIGDSFMIACKNVFAAVRLAGDLQRSFLQHDWKTNDIDDAYRAFEEEKAEVDEEYAPPTARLDAEVYRAYWNGLRVRAGVHTGMSDIRHDEVTKGYDYYGGTSNTAARTESVANGGQVLLTAAAYMALSAAERAAVEVTSLGAVALRGVPEPVAMYQLDAMPGRRFAALRLDRESNAFLDGESEGSSGFSSAESHFSDADLPISLPAVLSVMAPMQRLKMLQSLCERWSIRRPSRAKGTTDEVYAMALMERLVARVKTLSGMQEQGVSLQSTISAGGMFFPSCSVERRSSRVTFTDENNTGRIPSFNARKHMEDGFTGDFSKKVSKNSMYDDDVIIIHMP